MAIVVQLAALLMVASSALSDGLELDPRELSAALRAWRTLLRALCAALVLVPIGTLIAVRAFSLRGALAIDLVVLSVCPGGPTSIRAATAFGASAGVSVVLAACLGVLTAFTAGPSARALLAYSEPLTVHSLRIVLKVAAVQLLPLALGVLLQRRAPRTAPGMRRIFVCLGAVATAVEIAFALVPRLPDVAALGATGVLATLGTMGIAVSLGALMGDSRATTRSLAVGAALPNHGLAMVLVTDADAPSVVLASLAGIVLFRLFVVAAARAGALVAPAVRARAP